MKMRYRSILDVLCVAALVGACILHWPNAEVSLSVEGPAQPAWGTIRDALLDGPDAGEWARSMLALHDGRYNELETHRLPTWLIIVNAVMSIEPNVVRAGHLANHLLNLVLGLGVFAVGRLAGQRWIGLGAAALAMMSGHALAVSLRFGVDAAVIAMVPLAIVGAQLACRKWQLGVLSGVMAGLVMATHFSTLPYILPGFALILMCGGKGTRWLAAAGHVVGVAGIIWLLSRVFPISTLEEFQVAIANGISPGNQGGGRVSSWAVATEVVREGLDTALNRGVAQLMVQIRPSWLPWGPSLLLPWLGVLGIGLKRGTYRRSKEQGVVRYVWSTMDLGLGLGLLFCLAPVPVFAAAQAPLRYGDNLLPFGAILLVRGMASVFWILSQCSRYTAQLKVINVVYAVLGVGLFASAIQDAKPARRPLYPTLEEVGYWQLGQTLSQHFSPGSGVASPVREALVEGRLRYCPQRICPERATEEAYWSCLAVLKRECDGTEPVGYVVTDADLYDPNAVARRDMDVWIAENWTPAAVVTNPRFNAQVYMIPREEIPDLETLIKKAGGPEAADLLNRVPAPGAAMPDIIGGKGDRPSGQPTERGTDGNVVPGDVRPPTDASGRPTPGSVKPPVGADGRPVPGPVPPGQ
ncbi:MAG: hypothetical protein ACPGTU_06315 [Myxococcota bacterium]